MESNVTYTFSDDGIIGYGRRCNIRYCTHQQNQMNQPLQKNNSSGVCGVSYYPPRHKFRARIKISGHDIHLGYYNTFDEAVKARNVGIKCMFGQYGRYDDVGTIPRWIKNKVIAKCIHFASLSQNEEFSRCSKELLEMKISAA